jgi:single-stranded DNA-binding protein
MAWNNRVAVLGDITGDIYYDVLQISNQSVPFLRVYMMINETREAREVKGLRIVFYGVLAELAEAHLRTGSRILVQGHIQLRKGKNNVIVSEVVAEHVIYIRNFDQEKGNQRLKELKAAGKIQPGVEERLDLPEYAEAVE